MGDAWAVTSSLIAGMAVWGGIGFLVDSWLGFRWLFLPIGLVVGVAGGIYLVYIRYGRDDNET